MRRTAFFTICARNYLAYARTLGESLRAAYGDVRIYVFQADQRDDAVVAELPELTIVPIDEVEIPTLRDMAFRYNIMEFCTAIKPFCFDHLFDRCGYDQAIYLDPDIYVLRTLNHVTEALEKGTDCVLTPHITAPLDDDKHPDDYDIMRAGIYNLGFIAFSNRPPARRFIAWSRQKLAENCMIDIPKGIFVDQRFCDFVPAFIDQVLVLRHAGYNVAYWNLLHRPVARDESGYQVSGVPLCFAHFSGIDINKP